MSKVSNEENSLIVLNPQSPTLAGKMVIVTDDESRENEGDLVMAASKVTAEAVNQMALHARGLICVPMLSDQLRRLGINSMASENRESQQTDFAVSVDAAEGITTGISAKTVLRRSAYSEIQMLSQKCWYSQAMSFH